MRGLPIALALLLGGCANLEYSAQYRDTPAERFEWRGRGWWIQDKPAERRLMISPTLWAAAGQGFVRGITLGAADADIPAPLYRSVVIGWLNDRGRSECSVVDGYEIIRPEWEFTYDCGPGGSTAATVNPSANQPRSPAGAFPPVVSSGTQ